MKEAENRHEEAEKKALEAAKDAMGAMKDMFEDATTCLTGVAFATVMPMSPTTAQMLMCIKLTYSPPNYAVKAMQAVIAQQEATRAANAVKKAKSDAQFKKWAEAPFSVLGEVEDRDTKRPAPHSNTDHFPREGRDRPDRPSRQKESSPKEKAPKEKAPPEKAPKEPVDRVPTKGIDMA